MSLKQIWPGLSKQIDHRLAYRPIEAEAGEVLQTVDVCVTSLSALPSVPFAASDRGGAALVRSKMTAGSSDGTQWRALTEEQKIRPRVSPLDLALALVNGGAENPVVILQSR